MVEYLVPEQIAACFAMVVRLDCLLPTMDLYMPLAGKENVVEPISVLLVLAKRLVLREEVLPIFVSTDFQIPEVACIQALSLMAIAVISLAIVLG